MKRIGYWSGLCILLIVQELPLLWMLMTALRPETNFLDFSTQQGSAWVTSDNLSKLLSSTPFPKWCWNSIVVSFLSAAIATIFGNLFAFSLRFVQLRVWRHLKNFTLGAYLLPSMFLAFPLQEILSPIPDSARILMLPIIYQIFLFPLCLWIGSSYMDRIPSGVIAMAQLDYIEMKTALRLVFWPFAGQALWVGFALSFVLALQEYVYAFLLISDANWHTLPIGIASMQAGDVYAWSLIAAAGISCTVIVLLLLIMFRHLLQKGMTEIVGRMARGSR